MREERRLRVSENRVLKGRFGLERDEVTGEWRLQGYRKRWTGFETAII